MSGGLYTSATEAVLCPGLYNRLKELFGDVVVASRGEQMQYYTTQSGRVEMNRSGEYYRVNCPFCPDTRKRLWVNHRFGQLDSQGRSMKFLAVCYNEGCLEDYSKLMQFCAQVFALPHARKSKIIPFALQQGSWSHASVVAPRMPGECLPLSQLFRVSQLHPAVAYLLERGYTEAMFDKYGISLCTSASPDFPTAHNRIIFPVFMRRAFLGWQARYVGDADWRQTPKYYTMPGLSKSRVLYNFDNAFDKPFVVVTEGVTDCHAIGDFAVAIFGKSLSAAQADLLEQTWAGKPIIILLDSDAQEESAGIVAEMLRNGSCVIPVRLPAGSDPASVGREQAIREIYEQSRSYGVVLPI